MELHIMVRMLLVSYMSLVSATYDTICFQPTALVIEWLRTTPEADKKIRNLMNGQSVVIPFDSIVGGGARESHGSFTITRGLSDEVTVNTIITITELYYPNASVQEIEKQIAAEPQEVEQKDEQTVCQNGERAQYNKSDNRLIVSATSKCTTKMSLVKLLQRIKDQGEQSDT